MLAANVRKGKKPTRAVPARLREEHPVLGPCWAMAMAAGAAGPSAEAGLVW